MIAGGGSSSNRSYSGCSDGCIFLVVVGICELCMGCGVGDGFNSSIPYFVSSSITVSTTDVPPPLSRIGSIVPSFERDMSFS